MFDKLKLRQRILLGCSLPMLLLLGCMLLVFFYIRQTSEAAALLEEARAQEEVAYQINIAVLGMQRGIRGYLLFKNLGSRQAYDESEKLLHDQEHLLNQVRDPQRQEQLRRLLETANSFNEHNRRIIELHEAGRGNDALAYLRDNADLQRAREQSQQLAARLLKENQSLRKEHQQKFDAAIEAVSRTMLAGTLISVAATLAIIWWTATVLSRRISGYAAHLAAAATQIAATITEQERTAGQQAAAANETSVTIEQLSASSRQSAEQAASVASQAADASRNTEEGGATADTTKMAMAELSDKIGRMSEHIVNLNEQVGQIGIIATLVRDLSGEINMLALNAAVEAARAGEHGKGFAVVASEVRKLADQSKRSAEQAAGIITDIQRSTGASIMMTEDGARMVTAVTSQAEQVRTLFGRLAAMVENVNMSARQVMLNTQQQAAAFNQVVEAANSIAAGARETVSGISQTKNAVEQLNQTAQSLKAMS